MYSLRSLYRLMVLAWLILVAGLGCMLHNAIGEGSGSLFAFFFKGVHEDPAILPPVLVKEEPKTKPILTIPEEKPTKVLAEWIALNKGKSAGKGTLGKPLITTLASGEIEVRFAYPDTLGDFRDFYPDNVDSLSIDLMGSWDNDVYTDTRISTGVLKRVQVANHKQWVRVSGIARNVKDALVARVEYSKTHNALRIVFSNKR